MQRAKFLKCWQTEKIYAWTSLIVFHSSSNSFCESLSGSYAKYTSSTISTICFVSSWMNAARNSTTRVATVNNSPCVEGFSYY